MLSVLKIILAVLRVPIQPGKMRETPFEFSVSLAGGVHKRFACIIRGIVMGGSFFYKVCIKECIKNSDYDGTKDNAIKQKEFQFMKHTYK